MPNDDPSGRSREEQHGEQEERHAEPPSYDTSLENYAGIASAGLDDVEDLQAAKTSPR